MIKAGYRRDTNLSRTKIYRRGMKLTIVLTVYNKEQYLRRAFDALLSQEGTADGDFEVLVVNDGSTDGSAAIIEEITNGNKRFRVLNQCNQGLSMARNNGVGASCGDYVWFVDADDIISLQSVKLICGAIESQPDVIPIYAKTEGIDTVRNAIPVDVKTGKDILVCGRWQQCGVFYVYKKAFLKDNNLHFMPGIYHEDAEFTPRMLYAAKSVKVVPEVLYTVFRDPHSITQVPRAKRAFDYLTVAESLSRFVVDKGEDGTTIGNAIDGYTAQDINNAFFVISQNSTEEQKKLNDVYYSKRAVLNRTLRSAAQFKYKLESYLFSIFPKHYVSIYKAMKSFSQ